MNKGHVAVVGIAHVDKETKKVEVVLVYSQEHNDKVPMLKFSGGRRRNGEVPIETAVREVEEETGLRLDPGNLYHAGEREMGPRGERYDYHVYLTVVESLEGLKSEHVEEDASVDGKLGRKLIVLRVEMGDIQDFSRVDSIGMEILGLHSQFLPELEKMAKDSMQ